jgi:hypothetical protein
MYAGLSLNNKKFLSDIFFVYVKTFFVNISKKYYHWWNKRINISLHWIILTKWNFFLLMCHSFTTHMPHSNRPLYVKSTDSVKIYNVSISISLLLLREPFLRRNKHQQLDYFCHIRWWILMKNRLVDSHAIEFFKNCWKGTCQQSLLNK